MSEVTREDRGSAAAVDAREPVPTKKPYRGAAGAVAALGVVALFAGRSGARTAPASRGDVISTPPSRSDPASSRSIRETAQPAADAPPAPPRPEPYPRGRWRLADPQRLAATPIWMSHVLIRYKGSYPFVPLHPGWPEPTVPRRSRREALALAEDVYERARQDPASFSKLAREMSDDAATAEQGGSLGAVPALDLVRDPELLDALAATAPGDVSRPVASRYGYHVLLRRSPPPFEVVTGERVFFPYDSGPGHDCPSNAAVEGCPHSRSEAKGEAEALRTELLGGASIESIARRYRVEAIGTWTTWDSGDLGRERDLLGTLPVGGVSEPIDTPAGFELVERTPARAGAEYRVNVLELRFVAAAPRSQSYSKESRRTLADSLVATLARSPERFDELLRTYCCTEPRTWREGRERSALVRAVAGLADGAVAPTYVESDSAFLIPRRIERSDGPTARSPPAIPSPETADVLEVAKMFGGEGLQAVLRKVGTEVPATLGLDPSVARDIEAIHDDLAASFAADQPPSARERALLEFRDRLRTRLVPDQLDRTWDLLTERVTEKLMTMW